MLNNYCYDEWLNEALVQKSKSKTMGAIARRLGERGQEACATWSHKVLREVFSAINRIISYRYDTPTQTKHFVNNKLFMKSKSRVVTDIAPSTNSA